jgi:hypothetical protein
MTTNKRKYLFYIYVMLFYGIRNTIYVCVMCSMFITNLITQFINFLVHCPSFYFIQDLPLRSYDGTHLREVQGAYKLSEYFAKPYFHKYWTYVQDVTTIWKWNVCSFIVTLNLFDVRHTCDTADVQTILTQIPGRTNYARSVRQPFPSNNGLRFSREMAVATIRPFQMLPSLCVIDTNFTILPHFLLKLWRNEIFR